MLIDSEQVPLVQTPTDEIANMEANINRWRTMPNIANFPSVIGGITAETRAELLTICDQVKSLSTGAERDRALGNLRNLYRSTLSDVMF